MRISEGRFAYCCGSLNNTVMIHTALFREPQVVFPLCTVGTSAVNKKVNNNRPVCRIMPLFYHTIRLTESE